MNFTDLTISDVFAIKQEAKAKEQFYTGLQYAAELSGTEVQAIKEKRNYFADVLTVADTELLKRMAAL